MTAPHDNLSQSNTAGGANQFAPYDKLSGIKPGDRVRVTFEGERIDFRERSGIAIKMDGPLSGEVQFVAAEIDEHTFQIERIEPPLKVGDRVRIKRQDAFYEVLRIVGHQAVILTADGDPFAYVYPISDMERIA